MPIERKVTIRRERMTGPPLKRWRAVVWTDLGGLSWTDIEWFDTWPDALSWGIRQAYPKEVYS
jgi:hypothetical protein